jgi:hypothetical protein
MTINTSISTGTSTGTGIRNRNPDRRAKTPEERNALQVSINKLKELYHKLRFCNHYPKDSIKLLNRSTKSLETHLALKGVPQARMDILFQEALKEQKDFTRR